jgi:SnoaL-like domain
MKRNEFGNMLQSLADAWTRRDYESAASFFTENIEYVDPLRYSFRSRGELRTFFESDEDKPQITMWHTIVFDEEQQIGMAEYTYEGTYRYHGVTIVRLAGDKICKWQEYQHIDSRDWVEYASGKKCEQ